ncbi:MAG TPA: ABC transporter permease [Bryobacteraceae bacterium]|nr:ABC transporter permease [Bryobacteraceae bacterium]
MHRLLPVGIVQDLRYGARTLWRNRGFTAVAVLALALGIGVNTAVFTAYKSMVARPLDARNPSEMVNIALARQSGSSDFTFSNPDYEAVRDSVHSLSGVGAFAPERMTLTNAGGVISQRSSASGSQLGRLGLLAPGAGNAEFASVYVVSENYFQVLGVGVVRGRSFDSMSAANLAASPSVLISENYWQKRFGGDPAVLGKTIRLNAASLTIIGITPHDFVGTNVAVPDFWLPLSLEGLAHGDEKRLHDRENRFCRLFGRLAPGAGIARAQAEVNLVVNHLRTLHDPNFEAAQPVTAMVWPGSPFPLPIDQYPGLRLTIVLVMAAAAMVLLVACANVASLQLARSRARQSELSTRLSLGASRLRIIRQLLTESALLALLAGVLALVSAWGLMKVLAMLAADALPLDYVTLVFNVTPDIKVFAYVFGISLLAGVLFGLAPALESSRSALMVSTRSGTASVTSRRLQDLLITAQVALSLVLMIAGSMFIRSSIHALKAETGYDSKHVIALTLQFPETAKYNLARKAAIMRELRERVMALPGVTSVTISQPPDLSFRTAVVALNGQRGGVQSTLYYTFAEANYFQTTGIPLFLGRGFKGAAEQAVILSESAVRQLWPGQNPIGRSIRLGATDEGSQPGRQRTLVADGAAYEVIGVARDTRGVQFDGSDSKRAYLPLTEDRLAGRPLLIRTQSGTEPVTKALDAVLSATDPDLVGSASTLEERLRQSPPFFVSSLAAIVASTVGLLGLLLASMGIYGTVSYIVVLRTREVGIRMAIGAQKLDILRLILRESTRPVFAGLLTGLLLATGAFYLLRGMFYGINPIDSISFASVSALFLVIALAAAYPPSRRAMGVDPMVALRYE